MRFTAIALSLLYFSAFASAQTVAYSDGTFADIDWEILPLQIGNGGASSSTQLGANGCTTPPFRQVFITLNNPSSTVSARVFVFHRRIGANYNPSVDGSILLINSTECVKPAAGCGSGCMGTAPALRQNGMVYIVPAASVGPTTFWHTVSFTNLTDQNFKLVDFNPVTGADVNSHPDFSAQGGPIEFGFWCGRGEPIGSSGSMGTSEIDDWGIVIHREPGVAFCFGDGTGTGCPCNASGGVGEGCANTSGSGGALMQAAGSASILNDSFQLDVSGAPGIVPGLVLRGANVVNGGLGSAIGDGLLCTTGQTERSQVQVTAAGVTTFVQFNGAPFGASSYGAGVTTNYQFWYRDPANTCTGSGFNFSNAWSVIWMP